MIESLNLLKGSAYQLQAKGNIMGENCEITQLPKSEAIINRNIAIHDRIARKYESRHGEIFNNIEQKRLREALSVALTLVDSAKPRSGLISLDFGCGSGNLSRHLLDLGLQVLAADVSQGFLDLVEHRYAGRQLKTIKLNGKDLSNIVSGSCDMIAVYSVLHHIPNYLDMIKEIARVCAPGGVVYLDHEPTDEYWEGNPLYDKFKSEASMFDWRKYMVFSNYIHKIRRIINPRYANEGDIHVWRDDHVEWSKIDNLLQAEGFECVHSEDYLLSNRLYRLPVYEKYCTQCTDMRNRVYRKRVE